MSTIKSDNSDLTINASGTSKDIKFQADGTERMVLKSDGNVGIGVTPESDWSSSHTALQIGGNGSIMGDTAWGAGTQTNYTHNARWDGTNWTYISTDEAANYYQNNGKHGFKVAASGTADAAISWTTGFEVLNDGKARDETGVI